MYSLIKRGCKSITFENNMQKFAQKNYKKSKFLSFQNNESGFCYLD